MTTERYTNEDGSRSFTVKPTAGAKFRDYERFSYMVAEWDVVKLWDSLLEEEYGPASSLEIESAYKMIGAVMGVGLSSRKEGLSGAEYALSDDVDYSVPVLVVEYAPDPKDPDSKSILVVDGWSRIKKAYEDGFRSLPCYFFSDERVREIGAIDDLARKRITDRNEKRAAIAKVVQDLLDNFERTVESHKWRDLPHRFDLQYSEEIDDLAELLESWKEGELE